MHVIEPQMFDFVAVSGRMDNGRMIEHVAQLHEHFLHPVTVKNARYAALRSLCYFICSHLHTRSAKIGDLSNLLLFAKSPKLPFLSLT